MSKRKAPKIPSEQELDSEQFIKEFENADKKPKKAEEKMQVDVELKDKQIDESIYKKKKRKVPQKEENLDQDELQKQAIAGINEVQEQLDKLQKEERDNAIAMKLKYLRRFCIVHLDQYDDEQQYVKHMIRNHKLLAKQENLVKFQCGDCGDVFITAGKLSSHGCNGLAEYIKNTTPKYQL